MESNWVMALDNLASGGVIDFDAAAFLLDKPARFVGHPDRENLPLENISYLPKGTKLKDLPNIDTYEHPEDGDFIHNPTWKKVLVGTILGAGTLGLGLGILSKLGKLPFKMPKILSMPKIKLPKLKLPKISMPKVKLPKIKNIGASIKNLWGKATKYTKKMISAVASKLKKVRI